MVAFVTVAVAALPSAAHAIDCSRASSPIEHTICSAPALVRADAAMTRAYAAILKAAPDPEIHAMLVTSQKRWISARDHSFGDLDNATNGRTGAGYPKTLQRSLILHAIEDRTVDLKAMSDGHPKQPRLIQVALKQRRFAAQLTGGRFAGFTTSCSFFPRNGDDPHYDYGCYGTVQYRNNDRICGQTQDWATYRVYTSGLSRTSQLARQSLPQPARRIAAPMTALPTKGLVGTHMLTHRAMVPLENRCRS